MKTEDCPASRCLGDSGSCHLRTPIILTPYIRVPPSSLFTLKTVPLEDNYTPSPHFISVETRKARVETNSNSSSTAAPCSSQLPFQQPHSGRDTKFGLDYVANTGDLEEIEDFLTTPLVGVSNQSLQLRTSLRTSRCSIPCCPYHCCQKLSSSSRVTFSY